MLTSKFPRSQYHPIPHGSPRRIPGCIPEELMINILTRLPSKPLCRFKCVSKDFLFMIESDSQFKDLHCIQYSLKNPRLLQYDLSISNNGPIGAESKYNVLQTTFDLTSGQECDRFQFSISKNSSVHASFLQVTSCRELVCIYTDRQIMVLNPSTHQSISMAIEENETIAANSVGIGYVDSCKEYKVVRIIRARICLGYQDIGCKVYTVKDGVYGYTVSTKILDGPTSQDYFKECNGELLPLCVDGVLFWITITCLVKRKMVVNYMNLEDGSYGNCPFPGSVKAGRNERGATMAKLVEIQGYLCIQCTSSVQSNDFLVYALKDTKFGLWEKLYNIPYHPAGFERRSLFLRDFIARRHDLVEYVSFRPVMSHMVPHVVGFLPSDKSIGKTSVPECVISNYVNDETSRVHTMENGIIKTSAHIQFNHRKSRRVLHCHEGLFSFKST